MKLLNGVSVEWFLRLIESGITWESIIMLYLILGVKENIQEVVGHITEGVCRPLKVKVLVSLCSQGSDHKVLAHS
jgi:hypothetical protein